MKTHVETVELAKLDLIKPNTVWVAYGEDGKTIIRKIRILAEYIDQSGEFDGNYIYEELPSTMFRSSCRDIRLTPGYNLLRIFELAITE